MGEGHARAPANGKGAQLRAATAAIWDRYRDQVLGRVAVIEGATIALLEGDLPEAARREAEREAHRLAGSVGTFGFLEASRLARRAEQILMGAGSIAEAEILKLSEAVTRLRTLLEAGGTPGAEAESPPREGGVWLVGSQLRLEEIGMEAEARGYATEHFAAPAEAIGRLERHVPGAVVVDLPSTDPSGDGATWLAPLATAPLVVLDAEDCFPSRLEAARAGAVAYLTLPRTAASVVDILEEIATATLAGAKILAVDDDPVVLEFIERVLSQAGAAVNTVADPHTFWDEVKRVAPDLIILDMEMPLIDGLDLCRVLRADPRWGPVPVLFLTARRDAGTLSAFLEAGGDDYIAKPVEGPVLVRRTAARLARSRNLRALGGIDALTGLSTRPRFAEQANSLLELAARGRKPMSLLLLELDHLREINTAGGSFIGDEVLRSVARRIQTNLRPGDIIGRWGGGTFVLGMYDTPKSAASERMANLLSSLRVGGVPTSTGADLSITLSGGIAACPADGTDFGALVRAAEAALQVAQIGGRDRLAIFGAPTDGEDAPKRVDVLLVDDDPIMARLLLHTLKSHGYTHHWMDDGQEAAGALAGDPPTLSPRLVLLDVDLPGLDGFGVLRAIRGAGGLDAMKVIMLTVRASENEIVRALGGGAFDHVAKPVSLPILMQRIQRALSV